MESVPEDISTTEHSSLEEIAISTSAQEVPRFDKPPEGFTGLWDNRPYYEGSKEACAYLGTLGYRTHVKGFPNSHELGAAERAAIFQEVKMTLVKMAKDMGCFRRPISNPKGKGKVLNVLVVDDGGEVRKLTSQLTPYVKGEAKPGWLRVESFRESLEGSDVARGRTTSMPWDRESKDGNTKDKKFKADVVIMMDSAYYPSRSPQALYGAIRQWVTNSTVFLVGLRPLRMDHPGLLVEQARFPLGKETVVRTIGHAVTLGDGRIRYFSSAAPCDGLYTAPEDSWHDYSQVQVGDTKAMCIWGHRNVGNQVLLRCVVADKADPSTERADRPLRPQVYINAGVLVREVSRLVVSVSRTDAGEVKDLTQLSSLVTTVVVKELNKLANHVPVLSSANSGYGKERGLYTDFSLPSIITSTFQRAVELSSIVVPTFEDNGLLKAAVTNRAIQISEDTGLPAPVSTALSRVTQVSRSRASALCTMVSAAAGLWRDTKQVVQIRMAEKAALKEKSKTPEEDQVKGKDELSLSVIHSLFRLTGVQKPVRKMIMRVLSETQRNRLNELLGAIAGLLASSTPLVFATDLLSAVLEGFATAFFEESLKRIGGGHYVVVIGLIIGVVEQLCDVVGDAEASAILVLAEAFVRCVVHVVLAIAPFPVAVLVHGLCNTLLFYKKNRFVQGLLDCLTVEQDFIGCAEPMGLQHSKAMEVQDELGDRVDSEELKLHNDKYLVGDQKDSRRVSLVGPYLAKILVKPEDQGLCGTTLVGAVRLSVDRKDPILTTSEMIAEVQSALDDGVWHGLEYNLKTVLEVFRYFSTKADWDLNKRTKRMRQLMQALAADFPENKAFHVKTDELLKASPFTFAHCLEFVSMVRMDHPEISCKMRPIFGVTKKGVKHFIWILGYKEALFKHEYYVSTLNSKVDWVMVYMTKANAENLTKVARQVFTQHRLVYLALGDDCYDKVGTKALGADAVSCDLNTGMRVQASYMYKHYVLCGEDPAFDEYRAAHLRSLQEPTQVRDRKDASYSVRIAPQKSTESGSPLTSDLAWHVLTMIHKHAAEALATQAERVPNLMDCSDHDLGKLVHTQLSRAADMWGMPLLFEADHTGEVVLDQEEVTFLGGSFVQDSNALRWCDFGTLKSLAAPVGVYSSDPKENAVGHARVQHSICVTGMSEIWRRVVMANEGLATDALERHLKMLRTKGSEWEIERFVARPFVVSDYAWERQLRTIVTKHGGDEARVSVLIQELNALGNNPLDWTLSEASLDTLFLVRFGSEPKRAEVE